MTEYEVWRDAVFYDDEPRHVATCETYEAARDEVERRVDEADADLMPLDYDIRERPASADSDDGGVDA